MGVVKETLLPRSKPSNKKKIAAISEAAPRKSTRRILDFQSIFSFSGRCSVRWTRMRVRAHNGAWPRNVLEDVSVLGICVG